MDTLLLSPPSSVRPRVQIHLLPLLNILVEELDQCFPLSLSQPIVVCAFLFSSFVSDVTRPEVCSLVELNGPVSAIQSAWSLRDCALSSTLYTLQSFSQCWRYCKLHGPKTLWRLLGNLDQIRLTLHFILLQCQCIYLLACCTLFGCNCDPNESWLSFLGPLSRVETFQRSWQRVS